MERSISITNLAEDDINRLIDNFSRFVAQERDRYFSSGVSLNACQKDLFQGFFSTTLLEQVRIRILHDDERLAHPPDSAMAIVSGYLDLPDVTHMASFTYVDVLVFQEQVAERRLFHGLVHASQFALLGLKQYLELYIRAFLQTGNYITVPLEVQAFSLDARFAQSGCPVFSVEEQVRLWLKRGSYLCP